MNQKKKKEKSKYNSLAGSFTVNYQLCSLGYYQINGLSMLLVLSASL